eukprot:NODE_3431_length_555_cov_145.960474_g2897_i0.p2 GENE.NODE_3431_length_555_cov_145.960474_g2897_i0~~NODE_3431_length_555_cov_145.960474_g2897_i0.p2  ORF type:complete len:145 (-),score=15.85 NODE_3431_length_555_cov_145.960474_g2897_i0:63-497(-)
MAVLGEKAKIFFKDIYSNLWAYQHDFPRNKPISSFDAEAVLKEGAPSRKFMPWRVFYPQTMVARVRTFGAKSKIALMGVCMYGLYRKDTYLTAAGEGTAFARVHRQGFVRLPDGRLAQVNPDIQTDLSPMGLINTLMETLNPIP